MSKNQIGKPDIIGPWSEDKLRLLAQYLRAYAVIMNHQKAVGYFTKYHYIDAFAGAVVSAAKSYDPDDQVVRYIEGSPLRALQTDPKFDVCWFIDASTGRAHKLNELQTDNPGRDIRVIQGDCNIVLRRDVIREITRSSRQRGMVFLDPYGLQIEWGTMKALARAGTFDVFVNFSTMGIIRSLRRDELPDSKTLEMISRIMGDSDWIDPLYTEAGSFLNAPSTERGVLRAQSLARQYANRVGALFPHVSRPVIMYNTRNSPLYCLFLASHNETAVKKIFDDVTRRYERERTQQQIGNGSTLVPKKPALLISEYQASFFDEEAKSELL